ncbi:glutamate racemase [Granulosicoccus antarcticus]|uniref:Glutamate racemase n=1 Tax=Granulosicoccus antarcticus IMCC3135 TaxID=1192854 RepID=A0A2Z2NJE6_9GAMM|nr:glutamate racemase [Granulosicoccus antarcticus]ASJ70191.1 Glutamate racemase [Granulosicoccus antarcticus IMCC3135]
MTILVFDSGIGGLSVLREARMIMHDHRFVYVGDDAGFPYGDWDGAALSARMIGLFETLIEQYNPCLAIVACNTASTLIMPSLRSRFDIPFVGIVPAIKPAAERTASGLITVLATPGTVQRPYTLELIRQFASHRQVNLVGATQLARLSEQHMQGRAIDMGVLQAEIAPCFVESDGRRTDIITLGCTHYPFLVNEMRKLAPWPVDWLDPAEAVARHACHVLSELPQTALGQAVAQSQAQSDIAIMTSNSPPASIVRLLGSFGLQRHSQQFSSLESTHSTHSTHSTWSA